MAGCKNVTAEEIREVQEEEESTQTAMLRVDQEDQLTRECDIEPQPGQQGTQMSLAMRNLANILSGAEAFKDLICSNASDCLCVEEMYHSIDRVFRYYAQKLGEGVNKRTQSLITQFVRAPALARPFNPPANPGPSTSTLDENAISEVDFEGLLNEAAAIAHTQDIAANDHESDDDDEEWPGQQ